MSPTVISSLSQHCPLLCRSGYPPCPNFSLFLSSCLIYCNIWHNLDMHPPFYFPVLFSSCHYLFFVCVWGGISSLSIFLISTSGLDLMESICLPFSQIGLSKMQISTSLPSKTFHPFLISFRIRLKFIIMFWPTHTSRVSHPKSASSSLF
jgi:hypothetical protein